MIWRLILKFRWRTELALNTAARSRCPRPPAIVNEAFARRYLPHRNPFGARVREGGSDRWRTVIGVIGDVRHAGPAQEARPEVSIPYGQLDLDS